MISASLPSFKNVSGRLGSLPTGAKVGVPGTELPLESSSDSVSRYRTAAFLPWRASFPLTGAAVHLTLREGDGTDEESEPESTPSPTFVSCFLLCETFWTGISLRFRFCPRTESVLVSVVVGLRNLCSMSIGANPSASACCCSLFLFVWRMLPNRSISFCRPARTEKSPSLRARRFMRNMAMGLIIPSWGTRVPRSRIRMRLTKTSLEGKTSPESRTRTGVRLGSVDNTVAVRCPRLSPARKTGCVYCTTSPGLNGSRRLPE